MDEKNTTTPLETPVDPKAAHDAAEAQRKAEWDAKQVEKQAVVDKALMDTQAMSSEEVVAAAIAKLGGEIEPTTRRDMKLCVADFLRKFCKADPGTARKIMHPRKNMDNCIRYIGRHALEFLKEEAKAKNETLEYIAYDVPDDRCYKWAFEYFKDADAEEDKDKDDVFVPKQYYGPKTPKRKPTPAKPVEQVDLALNEETA